MNEINIVVYMEPIGKGRPRFSKVGSFIKTYTPKKTIEAEKRIQFEAREEMDGRKMFEKDIPLKVHIDARYEPPKSWSKKRQHDAAFFQMPKVSRPDCDNIEKLCMDALNGIVWHDDAQVVYTSVKKHYGINNAIQIIVSEVEC